MEAGLIVTAHIPERLEPFLASDAPVVDLARRFTEEGKVLFLVGGSLRDALLDREIVDLDLTTDARPDEIKRIAKPWADDLYVMGEAFGTIGVIRSGLRYEITTFRAEVYRDDSRKPVVSYSNDLVEDLSRRDFTINAMAMRIPGESGSAPEIVAPHGGLADLAANMLRTPLDPSVSFGDDPLRMLRLYRFVSTLGFEPHETALAAVRTMRERLGIVSPERIRDELDKLLLGPHVAEALWGIIDSRLTDEFLPELSALAMERDPVHHHKDVLAHTVAVVAATSPLLKLRLAALFHDIGKPETREFGVGGVSFHHHEVVGARNSEVRMRALRYPRHVVDDVSKLVFLHMRPHTYKMGWTDAAVRRYVRDAGPLLEMLNELVRSDVTTRNEKRANVIQRRIDELEERIAVLGRQEELANLRPPIDGRDVMRYLDLAQGPVIGEIMDLLYERRIEDGPYSVDDAHRMLDQWKADRAPD